MIKKITNTIEVRAFAILVFSIFGMLFVMRPMTWMPMAIILCCSLCAVGSATFREKILVSLRKDDFQNVAWPLLVWFVVCLFVGIWHLGLASKAFPGNAFRMALTLTTFALVVHVSAKKYFLMGLVVAGLFAAIDVAYGCLVYDKYFPRISGTTNHPIHFGNFSTLLAVLLVTVALLGRSLGKQFRIACLASAVLACGAAAASQSRSSVGVLLCLLPLVLVTKADVFHRWAIRLTITFLVAVSLMVVVNPVVQEKLRLKEAAADIQQVEANNYRTSIGARFAMWHAGWLMFVENPLLGIGPGKFQADFGRRIELGEVPMGDVVHGQPHNDLLHSASSGGLLKLMAYLFLMAGPFVFFYKKYKANRHDLDKRVFPIMGMQVVAAFFITGLTNSNFDLQIYSTMYAVLVCVLARLSVFEINAAEPSTLSSPAAPSC